MTTLHVFMLLATLTSRMHLRTLIHKKKHANAKNVSFESVLRHTWPSVAVRAVPKHGCPPIRTPPLARAHTCSKSNYA